MPAIRHRAVGPPSVLVLDDPPDLAPSEGQVRVAVAAAGAHDDLEQRRALGEVVLTAPAMSPEAVVGPFVQGAHGGGTR